MRDTRPMDILQAIGNTSMVRLRRVVPPGCADVFVKLEWENPTGSLKDRMANFVISRAEEDGRLKPGDTVIEYTGGSTGASLALVCAARGYRLQIVSSDAFSPEKLDQMAALGAELTLVRSEGGLTTKQLILDMIEAARRLQCARGRDLESDEGGDRRLRPLRRNRGFLARRRDRAQAAQTGRPDRRRRARRILGPLRGSDRAPSDRGRRDWLHSSALGPDPRRRNRAGDDGRRK